MVVSLLSSAFTNLANASPIHSLRHAQPIYPPLAPTGDPEGYSRGYKFRPLHNRPIGNPYRTPVMVDLWRYDRMRVPAAYPHSLRFRPVHNHATRFAGRTDPQAAGYRSTWSAPRARADYFGYSPDYFGHWRQMPPMLAAYPVFRPGYGQIGIPGRMHSPFAGQPNYLAHFRPLPAYPVAPHPLVAARWGGYPAPFWRVAQQPRPFPHFAPGIPRTSVEVAQSPRLKSYRERDEMQSKTDFRASRYAAGARPVANLRDDRVRTPVQSYRQNPVVFAYPLPTAPSVVGRHLYRRGNVQHYRFRPDDRLAANREPSKVKTSRQQGPSIFPYNFIPPDWSNFKFRPEDRFSLNFQSLPLYLHLLPTLSADEVTKADLALNTDGRSATSGSSFGLTVSGSSKDEPDLSLFDFQESTGYRALERFQLVVDNRIDRQR